MIYNAIHKIGYLGHDPKVLTLAPSTKDKCDIYIPSVRQDG